MRDLSPAGFFVLRTPLLPLATFLDWGAGGGSSAEATASDQHDRLRRGLAELGARPAVREAVFVASPDLDRAMTEAALAAGTETEKADRARRSLIRYVARLCSRPTPFGLFAGCTVGVLGERTEVRLGPLATYRQHTRLDMEYVAGLVAALEADPALRSGLSYRPNSSVYRGAGRVRYVESILRDRVRQHRLVAVDDSEYLARTLERAADGSDPVKLATDLVDGDITMDDAAGFIDELIDSQLLVSDLEPAVTGTTPLPALAARLGGLGSPCGAVLESVQARLEVMDQEPPGTDPSAYLEISSVLGELPAKVELPRLFQVDMTKPADVASLGPEIVVELLRAIAILHAFSRPSGEDALSGFRDRFMERYEGREVPLQEVLDEELGIGFDSSSAPAAEASPLLRDLHFPSRRPAEGRWSRTHALLLRRLQECLARGEREMSVSLDDAEAIGGSPSPLPDSLAITASIAKTSDDFKVLVLAAAGPSGARMLGRFCHTDPELETWVRRHLKAEEARSPDAVFAEVVHLPEGRIGNIVMRPVLRPYELAYLGRSGAPSDRQLTVDDLLVSVRDGRVRLRSARLQREVIPRLTSAHNYTMRSIGMYRFLCSLQAQGVVSGLSWDWGPLTGAPFLPRVTSGRLVLQRARWTLDEDDLQAIRKAPAIELIDAVAELRRRFELPRLVLLTDADNELLTDLDNPLSAETLGHLLRQRREAVLTEFFPAPEELWVEGPEGRFTSEVIVPFERTPDVTPPNTDASPVTATSTALPSARRAEPHLPGSEWLYLKLYCGTSTADALLRDVLAPLVRRSIAAGHVDRWFFIRYGDPDWHLRVRLHGDPITLLTEVLPSVRAVIDDAVRDGLTRRMVIDSYEPEAERYGGTAAMPAVERIFMADSEAVLGIVELLSGDEGMDARWRLAVVGCDMLLNDFGLDLAQRRVLMRANRDAFRQEFAADGALTGRIGERFRTEGRRLSQLLRGGGPDAQNLAPGLELLGRRSGDMREAIADLRSMDGAGTLTAPLPQVCGSLVHMHINRLLRSAHRAQELVIYDFLDRLYMAQEARR